MNTPATSPIDFAADFLADSLSNMSLSDQNIFTFHFNGGSCQIDKTCVMKIPYIEFLISMGAQSITLNVWGEDIENLVRWLIGGDKEAPQGWRVFGPSEIIDKLNIGYPCLRGPRGISLGKEKFIEFAGYVFRLTFTISKVRTAVAYVYVNGEQHDIMEDFDHGAMTLVKDVSFMGNIGIWSNCDVTIEYYKEKPSDLMTD